jgi:hypothetical protein
MLWGAKVGDEMRGDVGLGVVCDFDAGWGSQEAESVSSITEDKEERAYAVLLPTDGRPGAGVGASF